MGGVLSAGPYPDNPLVGNRPMKFPYTTSAIIAQYPYKFMWRYAIWYRFWWYALIPNMYIMYKLQKLCKFLNEHSQSFIYFVNFTISDIFFVAYSPSNVKKWEKTLDDWYGVKYPPEYDLY